MARDSALADKLAVVLPHLDERQRRVVLGAEARALGRGGISAVARAAGVSEPTVSKAVRELEGRGEPLTAGRVRRSGGGRKPLTAGRVRRSGGGRKPLTQSDPGLVAALEALVDPATRGDPESPLRWTSKSTRQLADELTGQGHRVSHVSVGRLLRARGYSLQAAAKTREGNQHPDRDAQFRYLTGQVNAYLAAGDPVISVDTKKKLRHEPAAALRHLRTAAEQASQRNAYAEAVRHARAGLERTTVIDDATEAARAEVALQTLLASSLIPLRGWADGDVEQAYRRACVLGDHLGDDRYAFRARYGLATLHEYRAEYERSQELMRQGLDRAADADDSSLIVGHELLACSQYHQGHFGRALQNASHGLRLYDPDRHLPLMAGAGEDPAVACHAWAAHSSWFLGDEDAALDHIAQALELAGENRRAFSLAYAHEQAAILHQHRDRPDLVAHHAAEVSRLGAEHGYPYRQATGAILHGWAVAADGAPAQGRAELEDGIGRYRATGAAMDLPYFLALLANVAIRMDDTAAASTALDEADALVAERPAYFYLPELARLRGLVHLVEGDLVAARAHLLESRQYAQRAGSPQLRARVEATLSDGLPDTVTGGQ